MTLGIAFLTHRFPTVSETFIANAAAGLIEQGCDVRLFGLDGPSRMTRHHPIVESARLLERVRTPRLTAARRTLRRLAAPVALARVARAAGVRAALGSIDPRIHGAQVHSLRPLYQAESFGAGRFDILHCQFADLAIPVLGHLRSGALAGALVVHCRGFDVSSVVQRHGPAHYAEVFAAAAAVIVPSASLRDTVLALGCPADRLHMIGSAIDLSLFSPARAPVDVARPLRLVTVGRLTEKKGLPFAIAAAALLRERGIAFEYRIVGEGPERAMLEDAIRRHGLADAVHLLGQRTQAEIAGQLAWGDVFVAPSIRARDGSVEGIINSAKEAFASALPVVSTWHGGIPELVEHGISGLLAPERDAAALTDHIARLAGAPELRLRMGEVGRKVVEARYGIGGTTRQMVDLYREVLARRGNGKGEGRGTSDNSRRDGIERRASDAGGDDARTIRRRPRVARRDPRVHDRAL